MKSYINIDWDNIDPEAIDLDKEVGAYIPLPDGSQHYLQMTLRHWYWLDRNHSDGITYEWTFNTGYQDATEHEPFDPEFFDDLIKIGLEAAADQRFRDEREGVENARPG